MGITVSGHQKIIKMTKDVTKGIANMKPANLAAAIEYEKWIKKNFQKKGGLHDNSSLKWKSLKESTVIAKKKIGRNASDILIGRTRNLMMRWEITSTNKYGRIRSSVAYSSIHENGNRRRNIPRRKIFPELKQGMKITKPVYALFMNGLIRKSGTSTTFKK